MCHLVPPLTLLLFSSLATLLYKINAISVQKWIEVVTKEVAMLTSQYPPILLAFAILFQM